MAPTLFAPWETKAEICRKILHESMKDKWLLSPNELPPKSTLNVMTFPETSGRLTDREIEITKGTATSLTERMARGELTATETVTAFLKRAHIVHQLCNYATEFMVEDALTRAAELDRHFKATGKLVGPFHGIPMSVKEHIGMKGRICHSTYVAFIDQVMTEDALLLRILHDAGAVFHVRTNEPQVLMAGETFNPIYGTTVNPYNRNLTPGGSSGGEGVAVGAHCSVIGLGTDIGGSIRVPAAFCGAYGLRTTALRNPYKGIFFTPDGQESIRCVSGPLARSIGDIDLFQKVVLAAEPWEEETSLVPLPWKKVAPLGVKDITIGVIWDDGICRPFPPITRALITAVSKLQSAGVRVVDFEPFDHARGMEIVKSLYFPDAAQAQKKHLAAGGEPIAPLTEFAFALGPDEPLTIHENWALNAQREAYREEYHHLMKKRQVDVLLSPAYLGVAAEHQTFHYWAYTTVWNILDQPAITFPTGLVVDAQLDKATTESKDFVPRSDVERKEHQKYSPERFADAPIALQLVGKHHKDENLVAACKLVTDIIQKGC